MPKPGGSGSSRAWEQLSPPLSDWMLEATASMGFDKMTPVQASTIPLFMGHKDVVVEAVTGSGKTLAFLIPVVERLLRLDEPVKRHHVAAIIVSPTRSVNRLILLGLQHLLILCRELATQIHSVLCSLLAFHAPSAAGLRALEPASDDQDDMIPDFPKSTLKILPQLLLGGTSSPAQDLNLFVKNSPNLLIATPGRLLELLSSQHVRCPQSSFEVLVMDEADRLLDLGFKMDLQKILGRLPKQRRTGLFSASVSEAVDQIIRVGLRNPVRIAVKVKSASGALDKKTPASLQLHYLVASPMLKFPTLASLLSKVQPTPQRTIVYVSTCAAVDYFQYILPSILSGFGIVPLHGKQAPNIRQKTFSRFVNSLEPSILLTTDVAARGLDIPAVDLVVQLDPPSDPKTFVHRCGRAGRAGRKGLAVTFLTPGPEEDYVSFLSIRQTPITPLPIPDVMATDDEGRDATERIREAVLKDRALHDKAQRAFVSWVQAYSKHTASSIFRVSDLPWEQLGHAWGLLKLPRMPELKKWDGDRSLGVRIDLGTYAYKDKQRERKRKDELQAKQDAIEAGEDLVPAKRETSTSWSEKKEQKQTREERRLKRKVKRDKMKREKMTPEQLAEQHELDAMIHQVRQSNALEEEEFHGFSD